MVTVVVFSWKMQFSIIILLPITIRMECISGAIVEVAITLKCIIAFSMVIKVLQLAHQPKIR